jgi:hypothetical protein
MNKLYLLFLLFAVMFCSCSKDKANSSANSGGFIAVGVTPAPTKLLVSKWTITNLEVSGPAVVYQYQYDNLNRIVKEIQSDPIDTNTFTYDGLNNLIAIKQVDGQGDLNNIRIAYQSGLPVAEYYNTQQTIPTVTLQGANNKVSAETQPDVPETISYTYDINNNVIAESSTLTGVNYYSFGTNHGPFSGAVINYYIFFFNLQFAKNEMMTEGHTSPPNIAVLKYTHSFTYNASGYPLQDIKYSAPSGTPVSKIIYEYIPAN